MKKFILIAVMMLSAMVAGAQEWKNVNHSFAEVDAMQFERARMSVGFSSQQQCLVIELKNEVFSNNGFGFIDGGGSPQVPRYTFTITLYDSNNIDTESFYLRFGVTQNMWVKCGRPEKGIFSDLLLSESNETVQYIIDYIANKKGYVEISGLCDLIINKLYYFDQKFSIKVPCMGNNKPAPKTNTTKKSNKGRRK